MGFNGVEQEVNGIDFLTKLTGWAIWKQTSGRYDWNEETTSWDLVDNS